MTGRAPKPRFLLASATAAALLLLLTPLLAAQTAPANAPHQKAAPPPSPLRFEISFASKLSAQPVDGRVYVLLSTNDDAEPRMQIGEQVAESQQIFGVDVDSLAPGRTATIDGATLGYPARRLAQIAPGDYYVQAVLNRYTTFHRADGHTVKLPMDEGEGQHWNTKPGNFYSAPRRLHVDPASHGLIRIEMTRQIPPVTPPKDTKYIKHLRIQSALLTRFWGRPMYLGAIVLLPEGFDTHPHAHYPLLVEQTHFPSDFRGFSEHPPAPGLSGFARTHAEYAYKFYQDWTSGRLPHVLILEIQHANPYYDDSYAVDSANVGPYGDAITRDLIPFIEKKFRGIGQGWARATYGGSTGGWEALASQVFYPDFYNGTWAFCPDPVDFHNYQIVDLYNDRNAYWLQGPFGRVARPDMRETDGTVVSTMESSNRWERVLGSHGRSGEQWAIWQAVFGPVGSDGYPKPIWDPATGAIDHQVAAYWQQHYDIDDILQTKWKTLGPHLVGKIHVSVGTMDTWYLNLAVRRLQKFLENTNYPYYAGSFDYGPGQPHCYTGEPDLPARVGGLSATERVVRSAVQRMLATAPPDADMSWRY
jgi:hypothetical protein